MVYLPTFTIKNQLNVGRYTIVPWILWSYGYMIEPKRILRENPHGPSKSLMTCFILKNNIFGVLGMLKVREVFVFSHIFMQYLWMFHPRDSDLRTKGGPKVMKVWFRCVSFANR